MYKVAPRFYLPYSPERCRWFTAEESQTALTRLRHEDPESHATLADVNDINKVEVFEAFKDWKIFFYMIMFFVGSIPNTAISNFLPTIVAGFGYSGATSNLLTAPPYVLAAITMVFVAYHSDMTKERTFHASMGVFICFMGYLLLVLLPLTMTRPPTGMLEQKSKFCWLCLNSIS